MQLSQKNFFIHLNLKLLFKRLLENRILTSVFSTLTDVETTDVNKLNVNISLKKKNDVNIQYTTSTDVV